MISLQRHNNETVIRKERESKKEQEQEWDLIYPLIQFYYSFVCN